MGKQSKIKAFVSLSLCVLSVSSLSSAIEAPPDAGFSPREIEILGIHSQHFDVHTWDRYVRKFRRAHQLSFVSGYDEGAWRVSQFGRASDTDFSTRGVDAIVQYSYHVPLINRFGYLLGTSVGYYREVQPRRAEDFAGSSAWKLPGLVAGFVFNYGSTGRVMAGGEAYLSRLTRLESINEDNDNVTIAVTAETIDLTMAWDRFVTLNWGVRLQGHYRKMWVPRPVDATQYAVNAKIARDSRGVSLGVVHHFL
jgi:hypothetical protein